MNNSQLILKLNWFYSLELNQVDLYYAQSKSSNSNYNKLAFERIAYIEQQHVDNIAAQIKKNGSTPSKLGDVISPILGSIAGKAFSLTSLNNALKLNIMLEQKAMQDYQDLINTLKGNKSYDEELVKVLQFNLIDEDLHTSWFKSQLDKENSVTSD